MSSVWITWEKQRRNRSMAERVGATLHELDHRGGRLARYWSLGWQTIRIVLGRSSRQLQKPTAVFYQNPSIVLATLVATLKFLRLTRARIIGDFHNAGVHPPVMTWAVPFIVRQSNAVIVSNSNLEVPIKAWGGRPISIPDPIPHLEGGPTPTAVDSKRFDVLFVCSWAPDEPIVEVLRAAELLRSSHPDVVVSITGRPKLERIGWAQPVPANVSLTGFLPEHEFDQRLISCNVVLDLTTRDDCMVCGAYEATSAEVPMVLSNNEPTRAYFRKGALYTDNTASSIAALIVEMKEAYPRFKREVVELKKELLESERTVLERLKTLAGG